MTPGAVVCVVGTVAAVGRVLSVEGRTVTVSDARAFSPAVPGRDIVHAFANCGLGSDTVVVNGVCFVLLIEGGY